MSAHEAAPWWTTSSGIRNSGGYICFTHAVQRYEGQDDRYVREVVGREASRRLIAAAPDLLAVAECHQALDTPGMSAAAVLRRHGWEPETECADSFLRRITDAAIKKATP